MDATVAEAPDRATVLGPLPVDEPAPEDVRGVDREPRRVLGVASVVVETEGPALDEQLLAEVFAVVVIEREPGAADDRPDESLGVVNVVQSQRQWRLDSSRGTFGIP